MKLPNSISALKKEFIYNPIRWICATSQTAVGRAVFNFLVRLADVKVSK